MHAKDGHVKLQVLGPQKNSEQSRVDAHRFRYFVWELNRALRKLEKRQSRWPTPPESIRKDQHQQYFKPDRQIENASTTSIAYRIRGPDIRCDNVAGHANNIEKPCL